MNIEPFDFPKTNVNVYNQSSHDGFFHGMNALKSSKKRKFSFMQGANLGQERICWVLYGDFAFESLSQVIDSLSETSKLLMVTGVTYEESIKPEEHEMELLEKWVEEEKIEIIFCDDPRKCATEAAKLIDKLYFDGWKPLLNLELEEIEFAAIKEFYQYLGEIFNTDKVLDATKNKNLVTYIENSFLSLPATLFGHDLEFAVENFDCRPVLLISAGPSLLKQLPLLAKHQSLFTIVTASAAYPNLKRYGIEPDYIVVVDPNKKIVWDEKTDVKIIKDLGCDPATSWSEPSQSFFTTHHPAIKDLFYHVGYDLSLLMAGGCVATSAFNVARLMKSNPIIMLGLDLAYTDGKARVDGYEYEAKVRASQKKSNTRFNVPGFGGIGMVETDPALLLYKTWFEGQLEHMSDTLVFNCTEGGADIKGTIPTSFENLCKELEKTPIPRSNFDMPSLNHVEHFGLFQNGLNKLIQDISDYRDLLSLALKTLKKKNKGVVVFEKLDAINISIKETQNHIKFICDSYSGKDIKDTQMKITRDESPSESKALEFYSNLYQDAKSGALEALVFLNDVKSFYQMLSESDDWQNDAGVRRFIADKSLNKY